MLGHGAGINYTGPGPRMGPTDNFSLVTRPIFMQFVLVFWGGTSPATAMTKMRTDLKQALL